MDLITSLQNERVKLVSALQTRPRTRRKERKIALEGARLVRDAINAGQKPQFVFYQPESIDYDLVAELQGSNITLTPVSAEVMAHISDTQNSQGIIGVFPLPLPPLPREPSRVLVLDKLGEPGNMGTMLRTAAAAGVECVLLAPDCADPYNPKVLRSGMGAHFRVPVIELDWAQIADYCQRLRVYIAAGDGDLRYDQVDWAVPWALIIGSEAHGVGKEAVRLPAHRIHIPMAAQTESLNAAVAAGIILFAAVRQSPQNTSG
jgi:RNA methyltransferase, TrmH family